MMCSIKSSACHACRAFPLLVNTFADILSIACRAFHQSLVAQGKKMQLYVHIGLESRFQFGLLYMSSQCNYLESFGLIEMFFISKIL
jgi:hypothetical protein